MNCPFWGSNIAPLAKILRKMVYFFIVLSPILLCRTGIVVGTHLGDPSQGPALWPIVRHVVNYPFWGKKYGSLIPDIDLNFVVDSPIGLSSVAGP